jgi:N-acetylmuramoyl-L-alanine amidase
MTLKIGTALLAALSLGPLAGLASGQEAARLMYTDALARERVLRAAEAPSVEDLRTLVRAYERVVHRFPASAYCDNALWQAANLGLLAYERFGDDADEQAAERLLTKLRDNYSSSSLVPRVNELLAAPRPAPTTGLVSKVEAVPPPPRREPAAPPRTAGPPAAPAAAGANTIREITRTPLPDGMRVSILLDIESGYRSERLEKPRRVFFDLKGARPAPSLLDATLTFPDSIVREIRLGRHPQNTTRIVMDMEGADSYSVFTLYNPFRLVIDFRAAGAPPAMGPFVSTSPPIPLIKPRLPAARPVSLPPATPPPAAIAAAPAVEIDEPPAPPIARPPAAAKTSSALPTANSNGQFSVARQLGLGVSRIVIDAGHGGHDPGAQANGLSESELVLDVAQRLTKLLQRQTTIEVVMTRDSDVFIPLEERTAIANRESADLFLSIHANASRNVKASGIETYFLNFASNPEAEAVAARENSASARTMHNLPDILKAIALNSKIDESREFAEMVQRSMVRRLAARNRLLKDLGVKQAPFVVLIGAGMPSVLAEISFVTHRQEGQLLKSGPYRQQIAEALLDAVLKYQTSLKKITAAAAQPAAR